MNELLAKIKESKKLKVIIVIMLCALTAIIYFLPDGSDDRNKNDQTVISNNSEDHSSKEKKLEEVLSNIKGAGRVSVMITYQSSSEVVTASSTEQTIMTIFFVLLPLLFGLNSFFAIPKPSFFSFIAISPCR